MTTTTTYFPEADSGPDSRGLRTSAAARHTPERWSLNGFNLAQIIKIGVGPNPRTGRSAIDGRHQVVIAICPSENPNAIEDAAHIVACVNACAGADADNLRARPYEEIRKDLLRTISEARQAEVQRDELLASLRLAKTWLEGWASADSQIATINVLLAKHGG